MGRAAICIECNALCCAAMRIMSCMLCMHRETRTGSEAVSHCPLRCRGAARPLCLRALRLPWLPGLLHAVVRVPSLLLRLLGPRKADRPKPLRR